jgi:prepilin-type N-terminal cleavage/methylation domain-containing protein
MERVMSRPLLRRVVSDESGLTLIELMNVLVIMSILLLIAVPSYLSLKDKGEQAAAKSNLRAIIPAVILYAQDNTPASPLDPDGDPTDTGWTGLSAAALQTHYDPTIDTSKYVATATGPTGFCVYTWVGPFTASEAGPGGGIGISLNSAFNPSSCSGHL